MSATESKTCPYVVLQVSNTATIEEIKKSYKRLAIVHHPDKNQGSAEATQMFQKISSAYAVLSDPEKRERYDMTGSLGENDMEGHDMDDLMQMFFQSFGPNVMFGGSPMFFEMGDSGHRRGSRRGASNFHEDLLADMLHGFDFGDDGSDDMFEDDYEEDLDDLQDFVEEVLPALFCEYFIRELDSMPVEENQETPVQEGAGKKKKKADKRPIFLCKLCKQIRRSVDAAESHYMQDHPLLMERFVEILMKEGMESDVSDLFEVFAEKVLSGAISEKKPRKRPSKKKRKKRVTVADRLAAQQRAPQTSNASY